ncbi:MAG: phosphatidylserine decarboxylase, partial [Candidatus Aminicenantes bacterium]|nr:phosphatidylserine decarboxylase [Candidatus Aminicenantes bacterium]
MDRLKRFFLHCISSPCLSRIYGRVTRIKRPRRLARFMIRAFQRSHSIDMDRFQGTADDYSSLAEFFVRPLDTAVFPKPVPDALVSPADGMLVGLETVAKDSATQVKGLTYSLVELMGEEVDFSPGWHVATVYLSPSDYHRFHHPLDARATATRRLGASRFPVNPTGGRLIPRLFVRNERIVVR